MGVCERENLERESQWEEVKNKRRQKGFGGNYEQDKSRIKFYVSNILDGCRPWDLGSSLGELGSIAGVYIARKRNKMGDKFGFVTFKGVRDRGDLIQKMKSAKVGKYHLVANVARFAAENGEGDGNNMEDKHRNKAKPVHLPPKGERAAARRPFWAPGGLSFKEAVMGDSGGQKQGKEVVVKTKESALSEYHSRAVVVRCSDFKTLVSIVSLFEEAGFHDVEFKYLGGLSLLVSFVNKEKAIEFMYLDEIWRKWFTKVDTWVGQVLPFERIIWLSVTGVPLHLALSEVVTIVGNQVGKVVAPPDISSKDFSFDKFVVGVLSSDGYPINKMVTVKWEDKVFRVWITEDNKCWRPFDISKTEKGTGEVQVTSSLMCPEKNKLDGEDGKSNGWRLHTW